MQCEISREILLKPLQLVAGAVDNKQTMAILSNLLLVVDDNKLALTGTDCEIEMHATIALTAASTNGSSTVPARKLVDICKTLPAGSNLKFKQEDNKIILKSGRSKFSLLSLPADDFPNLDSSEQIHSFKIAAKTLLDLLDRTKISIAQQDVRHFLNGMLFEVQSDLIRTVSTDGHRLSSTDAQISTNATTNYKIIVPRKGILELIRLLAEQSDNKEIEVVIKHNHLQIISADFSFTSKLIDGEFPDYERVIPRQGDKLAIINKNKLRESLNLACVLSTEKLKRVDLSFSNNGVQITAEGNQYPEGTLTINSNNTVQEESEEQLNIQYQGSDVAISFNAAYVLDILSVIKGDNVIFTMNQPESAVLIQDNKDLSASYVVMPITI